MAFPQIAGTPVDTSAAGTTSHTLNLPSGIVSGEKLLVVAATRLQTVSTGMSFPSLSFNTVDVQFNSGAQFLGVYERTADATEGSTTTLSLAVSAQLNARVWRISGAQAIEGTGTTVNSVTVDPPSLDPTGWAAEDTLWFALAANNAGTTDLSAFPANYTTGKIFSNNSGRPTLGYGYRELNATSEDPGAYTYALTSPSSAITVGIRPAAASGWSGRTAPNTLLGTHNLAGSLTDIDDDPDSPDANWLVVE